MIRYHTDDEAPHIHVEGAGVITQKDVRDHLGTLPSALDAVAPGFVLLAEYPNLLRIEDGAVGRLFYHIARVFEAEPGLVVFVTGGQERHPGLREFTAQLDTRGIFHVVDTREEADRLIAEFAERS